MKVPGLDERIAQHARAVVAGDLAAAESLVAPSGLDSWRAASATLKQVSPGRHELLACAKIGMQYIAKIRFHGAGAATLLIRWKNSGGKWVIAEAEDVTAKRSPWSDIPHYTRERGGETNA